MKPAKRAKLEATVRQELRRQQEAMPFHILTITFADGQAIDLPYQPWHPRQRLELPGRWIEREPEA